MSITLQWHAYLIYLGDENRWSSLLNVFMRLGQVTCLAEVESLLAGQGIEYVKQCIIEEDGIRVTQVRDRPRHTQCHAGASDLA